VKVYNDIIKQGHVTRGSVGIGLQSDNNSELLKVYGAEHGVFVSKVFPDTPAEKAGMKVEDVVTSINGKPINKGQDLIDIVADSEVGSTLKFGIIRDKKPMTLNIVVGDRTKTFAEQYGGKPTGPDSSSGAMEMRFGMTVQPLNSSLRQQMGLKGTTGVLVASVEPGSFADDIGLAKGDVIVELNRQAVSQPEDVKKIQSTLKPGDAVAFHIMRQAVGSRGGGEWTSAFVAGKVPDTGNQ
jgi:serine protease Do